MKHRLTASRIKLGRHCLYWARPDVEVPSNEVGRAAAVGTALHEAAEAELDGEVNEELVQDRFVSAVSRIEEKGPPPDAAASVSGGLRPSEQKRVEALVMSWLEWWQLGEVTGPETEVPIELSWNGTGARLPNQEHRDYSTATERSIPGTADLVGIWAKNDGSPASLAVIDYKTGQAGELDDHIDQLIHLGTAFASDEGADHVRIGVLHVTPHGAFLDSRVLDRFDMLTHVEEMAALLAALPTAEPRPGLHCEELYCPARAVCPSTRALLADAKIEIEPRRRLPVVGPIEDNDQAHAVLVAVPLIEAWLAERVKAAKRFADEHGGIVAPDGRIYRGRPQTRETPRLDVEGAIEAMHAVLGAAANDAIQTKVTTSFEAMREVIRAKRKAGEKIPIEDTIRHVREALRDSHALKVSEFTQYDWANESDTKKAKGKRQ